MAKKSWSELSAAQQGGILLSEAGQFVLTTVALLDIYRRPREDIRGNKAIWTLASFVNFVGSISYFLFGHKR
jgi:hypothetical protein